MKKAFKLISLFLAVTVIFSLLASCTTSLDEEGGSVSGGSELSDGSDINGSAGETSADYGGMFPIFKDGKYTVKVVSPDIPTDTEKAVYTKLRNSLKSKTKVNVEHCTDYLKDGESYDKSEYVILVGKTDYPESEWIYNRTKAGSYGIQSVNDTRMTFYFSTESEGLKLVDSFISAIKTDNSGYFYVNGDYKVEKNTVFKAEAVPSYPTSTTKVDCGDDTVMLVAKSTNLSNYEKYCSTLTSSGYTEYSRRDNINGNYYRIYTKGTMALNVYFTKSSSTVRIISGPLDDIPTKDVDRTPETNKSVTLTMLAQGEENDCGLGLVIHLPNGKFLIFDGGFPRYDKLYKQLNDITPKGKRIVIAGWFVSHPHGDHQEAVTNFIQKHAESVEVENIFYNYAPASVYEGATEESNTSGIENVINGLNSKVNGYFGRTTKVIKPHTGQVYTFGSVTAEILYTVEDVMPSKLDYVNSSSLIVRFNVKGQTILALADATHKVSTILQDSYGSYLKSDIVQLAHHGTYPGHASLYTKINAPVLLWPSNTANAKAQYSNSAVKEALAKAKDVYLSKDTDIVLTLPYTVKNNKQSFLKGIGK